MAKTRDERDVVLDYQQRLTALGQFRENAADLVYKNRVDAGNRLVQENQLWVAGDMQKSVERAARLGDAWMCGASAELGQAAQMLEIFRATCAAENKPANWILRRFAWIKPTRKEVEEGALQPYVDGLLKQWRNSSKEDATGDIIRRIDGGEAVPATEIAHNRLIWGSLTWRTNSVPSDTKRAKRSALS